MSPLAIPRSSEYSTAFAVQSTIEEKLEDGNLGFELFLAVIPGGSTASTIEEEYYAPDGNGRWGRVAFAFGADVIETLTLVGKFKNASEVASVYRAMAVANSGNAVYAGIDAATRFAEGKDGAWGKSFEALVSLVGVKINLAQYKAAAQKLDAAAKELAAVESSSRTKTLYWHGSRDGVERAVKDGLFAHGTGNGAKFWATSRGKPGTITNILNGGNYNVESLIPLRLKAKGGFDAVYQLTPEEAAKFHRAWGPRYSWNPYQWYKGATGQYVYSPMPVTWAQRRLELRRFGTITVIVIGGTWAGTQISDWRNQR